jgi:hypothetical protein
MALLGRGDARKITSCDFSTTPLFAKNKVLKLPSGQVAKSCSPRAQGGPSHFQPAANLEEKRERRAIPARHLAVSSNVGLLRGVALLGMCSLTVGRAVFCTWPGGPFQNFVLCKKCTSRIFPRMEKSGRPRGQGAHAQQSNTPQQTGAPASIRGEEFAEVFFLVGAVGLVFAAVAAGLEFGAAAFEQTAQLR